MKLVRLNGKDKTLALLVENRVVCLRTREDFAMFMQRSNPRLVCRGGHWGVLNTAKPQQKIDKYRIIAKKFAKYRNTARRPKPCQKSMK